MARNREKQEELLRAVDEMSAQELGNIMKEVLKAFLTGDDTTAIVQNAAVQKTDKISAQKISKVLMDLGMPTAIRGFEYLKTAIPYYAKQREKNGECSICYEVYTEVARVHSTIPSRVERAIRHAIEVTYNRGNEELLKEYVGYSMNEFKKLTNAEFISVIVERLKYHD